MIIFLLFVYYFYVRGGKKGEWDLFYNCRSGFKNFYKNYCYGMFCRVF